jgi:heme/copper-type cytochrome/quinol oxidase subunit 2
MIFFLGMVLAVVLGASEVALACPVCFRVEENATTHGVQAAVLVLVGVTTVVLGAFARFIAGFVKRESRRSKEPEC